MQVDDCLSIDAGSALNPAPGFPRLVADIGGSNARFGWVTSANARVQHIRKLSVQDYRSPALAANAYLSDLAREIGTPYQAPRRAAIAVAAMIDGDLVDLTNSGWQFSRSSLQAELALDELLVLNDFEALALSLPRLNASQLRNDHGSIPAPQGTMAVIGPGTGLGVAGVVETRHGWVVLPSEGGHATLSAADDFESVLLAVTRKNYPHVSAERFLSGIGLPILHAAVSDVLGMPANASYLTAEQIVDRGLKVVDGSGGRGGDEAAEADAVCSKTLDVFCAQLGSFAGNVALTLGARGGVYIGGGIVPRLGERFFQSQFRERFEAKGRFESYLKPIPTVVITDTLAALTGAALAIEQQGA